VAANDAEPDRVPLAGFQYFDRLVPLLARLHDVGCARDAAGNRVLHYDQYCLLVLLALFNPTIRSLRALQQASTLRQVQRRLGCPRTSLGSLSEAAAVDPLSGLASSRDLIRTRTYNTDSARWPGIARAHSEVFGDVRPSQPDDTANYPQAIITSLFQKIAAATPGRSATLRSVTLASSRL